MRKSNLFSVITEVICAVSLTFIGIKRGFDWLLCLAIGLNVLALVMNLVMRWYSGKDENDG